ncbi:MAG: hypothetical protein ACLT98_05790 [Eggerthellaceae bacterium]
MVRAFEADETDLFECGADAQGYFRRFYAEIFRAEGDVVLNERGRVDHRVLKPCLPWSGLRTDFLVGVSIPSVDTDPASGMSSALKCLARWICRFRCLENADELSRCDMRVDPSEDKPVLSYEFNIGAGNHGFCSFVLFGATKAVRYVGHSSRMRYGGFMDTLAQNSRQAGEYAG